MVEHENWATPQYQEPFDLLSENNGVNDEWAKYLIYGVPLYKAALRGDWKVAARIKSKFPECFAARITERGDTALHIAAVARHAEFVSQLMNSIEQSDSKHLLTLKNNIGNTALCLAAASGTVATAKVMIEKNHELPEIRGNHGLTPLHMAALLRHREMVKYLLPLTVLSDNELSSLFLSTINANLYDVALELLKDHSELAIVRDEHTNETPLHALATKHMKSYKTRLGKFCDKFSIFGGHDEAANQHKALQLLERIWGLVLQQGHIAIREVMDDPWQVLFEAVEVGNVEFVTTLVCSYPDLIWKMNDRHLSIFHIAVKYRREKIFRLIYDIGAVKDLLARYVEIETRNNMLHLAAILPSSPRLNNSVSGAALQMQREMLWFKVVSNLVPQLAEDENAEEKTPHALFTEEHKQLRVEGEEWMRKTASSCSFVATLIAAVVFGAALKVPGSDNGAAVDPLSHGAWHWVFAISDSLSLVSSTASILTFLSILTSRYAEEDFLQCLPRKLIIGLTLLFISIATMMIAFTATFQIIFKHGLLWIVTATLACVPIILFAVQEFPLLVEVYRSTIGSAFIFKPQHQLFCELHLPNKWRKEKTNHQSNRVR